MSQLEWRIPFGTAIVQGSILGRVSNITAIAVDRSGNVFVTAQLWNGSSFDYVTIKPKYAGINKALPAVTQVVEANDQFQLFLNADSNRAYIVEFRDFLDSGSWATLTNFAAQPMATTIIVTNAMTNAARFFRLRNP